MAFMCMTSAMLWCLVCASLQQICWQCSLAAVLCWFVMVLYSWQRPLGFCCLLLVPTCSQILHKFAVLSCYGRAHCCQTTVNGYKLSIVLGWSNWPS